MMKPNIHERRAKTDVPLKPPPESHSSIGGFLKEAVFGFNDGLVSTFALIAGLTAGMTDQKTVLLGALATLFAGAFSVGLGTYLGSKSERDLYKKERAREIYEMKTMPEIERQEIRDIYAAKGFRGQLLEDVVSQITGSEKVWLETMLTEELGFAQKPPKPGMNGLVMSAAFIIGALIPTIPYFIPKPRIFCITAPCGAAEPPFIFGLQPLFFVSFALSIAGLLVIGGLKTKFTGKNVIFSALETLFVGAVAASGSYGIGLLFL